MVSIMTTGPDPSLPRTQAKELIEQLQRDEHAIRYPPLPLWFFITMASVVAGVHLAQLLPASDASKVSMALAIVGVIPAFRYWLCRDGVSWVSPRLADMAPFVGAIVGTYASCGIVSASTGADWVWALGAAVAGAVVLATGGRYRQAFGDGT